MRAGLASIGATEATPIQQIAVPRIISGENILISAPTGTGKTLSYLSPIMEQLLKRTESGDKPKPKKPRAIVLVPTRELAQQVSDVATSLVEGCDKNKTFKVASVLGGAKYKPQKIALNQPIDLLVATPKRLLEHYADKDVFFTQVSYVILDEVDMLLGAEYGFQEEMKSFLTPLQSQAKRQRSKRTIQYIGAAATLRTSSGKQKNEVDFIDFYRNFLSLPKAEVCSTSGLLPDNLSIQSVWATTGDGKSATDKPQVLIDVLGNHPATKDLKIEMSENEKKMEEEDIEMDDAEEELEFEVEISGTKATKMDEHLEKLLLENPNIQMENVTSTEEKKKGKKSKRKTRKRKKKSTLIFCNTLASSRYVHHILSESGFGDAASVVHGRTHPREKDEIFHNFRKGNVPILVSTDTAMRGLDFPLVEHVILFDFPHAVHDFVHRVGRTARGGKKGRVTAILTKRDKNLARNIFQGEVEKGK
eukprot:g537.t1